MRTILARHLTGDDVEREIEVYNVALAEWMPGKLEDVTHRADMTTLAVYWDEGGTLGEWHIHKDDACVHVRVPELPAEVPWARARFIEGVEQPSRGSASPPVGFVVSGRRNGKRAAALDTLAGRASVLGPCPECLVAAGEPCVALPDEPVGTLGRIHGERILEARDLAVRRTAAALKGRIL